MYTVLYDFYRKGNLQFIDTEQRMNSVIVFVFKHRIMYKFTLSGRIA